MSQLGLSGMVIGNHEFDKGSVNLFTQFSRFGGFPILAANYDFGDPSDPNQTKLGLIVPPYAIYNVDGLKVGRHRHGQPLVDPGASSRAATRSASAPSRPKSALAAAAEILRPQVDLLVVVSHLGLDEDENVSAAEAGRARGRRTRHRRSAASTSSSAATCTSCSTRRSSHPHRLHDRRTDRATRSCATPAPSPSTWGASTWWCTSPTRRREGPRQQRSRVKSYTYKILPVDDSHPRRSATC